MLRQSFALLTVVSLLLGCSTESGSQPVGVTCPEGATTCGTTCVNLQSDANNCGQCGAVCVAGQVCSLSVCSANCAANLTPCGSSCVDLTSDFTNCGQCGVSCGSGSCTNGACVVAAAGGGSNTGVGGSNTGVGGSTSPAGGGAGGTTSPTTSGGAVTTGGMPATDYVGFLPVPSSANTTNYDPALWYVSWKAKFYQDCGSGQARIAAGVGDSQTFSEGIGYGMLLAVGNDDRTAFDALWSYYQGRLDSNGLMNWKINACTTEAWGQYAATDAEEDVAMALIQADAKWSGYQADAIALIAKIKQYETVAGTPSYLRPGDAANNGGKGDGIVNPSYFAIGYWHVWANYTSDTFWNQLADDAYKMLASYQTLTISGSTGLVPDWGNSAGLNPNNGGYYYDACRTPWRVAVDYVWFGTPAAQTFLQNISTYVDSKGGVASVPFDKNSAFLGAFALSGMAVSQAKADTYLNAWLSATMDDAPYFQGSLRGLYLLLANHKFPRGI